jgi:phosphoribosylanthranilate isomerase
MTRTKLCGMTSEADVEGGAAAGTEAVGIICDVPVDTHRKVSPERAATLAAAAPPFVTTVLVTMPDSPEAALDLLESVGTDAVQLHGTLDRDDVAAVRDGTDATVLVALDADEATATTLDAYDPVADGLLVDTPAGDGGGGTGETHDWDRTRRETADLDSPVILAGGLSPENVAEAIRAVEPFAVDVASGIETAAGSKDSAAMRTFVERAKTMPTTAPEP